MNLTTGIISLILMSLGLGVGLAMDAFSVSLSNGLNEPKMRPAKMALVAGVFALMQAAMPFIGWVLVSTVKNAFQQVAFLIPWFALALLGFIGTKMLIDGIRECRASGTDDDEAKKRVLADGMDNADYSAAISKKTLGFGALMIQGVATSIDALSVGFTIADYGIIEALISVSIIALVTFPICLGGIFIGKKVGDRLAGKAGIFGGAILIFIGLEIFITSWF